MKNASKYVLIMTFILMFLSVAIPAFANEGAKPAAEGGMDEWDDDVWSDWGTVPPTTKGGATDKQPGAAPDDGSLPNDLQPPTANTVVSGGGGVSGSSSFGTTTDKVRFHLVREGYSDGPRGVRKHRPSYGRRKTL